MAIKEFCVEKNDSNGGIIFNISGTAIISILRNEQT